MDAITLLREDHLKVLAMLDELEKGISAAVVDADRQRARKQLVTELVIAESQHEAVEEEYFWPAVRDALPDGNELADRAIEQEDAAKHLLHDLDRASADHADFEKMVSKIIADGREHIEYEQTAVWPKLQAALSTEQLNELGEKMARAKEKAPTRPHPATPSSPGALKTAGKAAAAMDRARDSMTGRGRS